MNRTRSPRPPRGQSADLARALAEIRREKRRAELARPAAAIAQEAFGRLAQTFGGRMPAPRRAPR